MNVWLDCNLRNDDDKLIEALSINKINPILISSVACDKDSNDIALKIKELIDTKIIAGTNQPYASINFYNNDLNNSSINKVIDDIYETIKDYDDINVILTGGASNLIYVINAYPDIVSKIKKVIFVGGAYCFGSVTPVAEHNVYFDPEALKILLTKGLDFYFIPEELKINDNYSILALLALLNEEVFEFVKYKTGIELYADYTRGMTVIYRRDIDHFEFYEDDIDGGSELIRVKEEDKNAYYPEIKDLNKLIPLIDKLNKGEY